MSPRSGLRRADQRGAASGLVLAVAAVVVCAGLGAGVVVRVLVAHRAAGSVADLGALAGAVAVQRGSDGCAAARRLVERSGATTPECHESEGHVRLVVRLSVGRLLGREVTVRARAHAGPR